MGPVEGDTDEEGEEMDNMFPFMDEDVANMFGDEDEPDKMSADKVDDLYQDPQRRARRRQTGCRHAGE